jgi:hypothetical protein
MKIGHVAGVLVMSALVPSSPAQENLPGERIARSDAAWSAITLCARIAKDRDRHVCLDDALRNAGLMPAHPSAASVPAAGTAPAAGASAPAAAAGAVAPAAAAPAAQAPDAASPAQSKESRADFGLQPKTFRETGVARTLKVTLRQVDQADGKLLLTTTEGAIWKQVESTDVWPVPTGGQTMTIERGSFGGFYCEPSKYVSFRCFRAK